MKAIRTSKNINLCRIRTSVHGVTGIKKFWTKNLDPKKGYFKNRFYFFKLKSSVFSEFTLI